MKDNYAVLLSQGQGVGKVYWMGNNLTPQRANTLVQEKLLHYKKERDRGLPISPKTFYIVEVKQTLKESP